MKKYILSTLCLLVLAVFTSTAAPKEAITLNYEKYTLPNGLEVVLHVDQSDPIVSVAIQYHVGSSREKVGKTGFAHFFEHMLFQRSENLPRNAFFKKIGEMGGSFNGSTSMDGTNYYETVPRDALEKVLWMESDRMGYFINTVSQAGLEREVDVVSNEKRQGENRPYGKGYSLLLSNYYPEGHPYSWPVIGSIKDLRGATIDDVKEFYHTFYSPSNATLVIAGDIDQAKVKTLVNKYFGEIEPHGEVEKIVPQLIKLDKSSTIFYQDNFATTPSIEMRYPAVEQYHPDSYPLRVMAMILSNGKNSPFYKVLINDKKIASNSNVAYSGMERDGAVSISASGFNGTDLDDIAEAISEAFAKFEADGVDTKELARVKIMQESSIYNLLTTVEGKALSMARNNVFGGSPDKMIEDLKQYNKVTAEDVMRVYNKYVKGKNCIVLCAVPKGAVNLAVEGAKEAFPESDDQFEKSMSTTDGAIVDDTYKFSPSKFDRSVEPALMSNTPEMKSPNVWSTKLDNGIKVNGIIYNELPTVNFRIMLNGGKMSDPADKVGLASFTAAVLNNGTANKTSEELASAIGQLGARIAIGSNTENMYVTGSCLSKNFDKVMELVSEMLLEPRWDTTQISNIKMRFINGMQQVKTDPKSLARKVFGNIIYGQGNVLSTSSSGTEEVITRFTIEDAKKFYADNISPSQAVFNYVGNLNSAEVVKALHPFAQAWKPNGVKATAKFTPTPSPAPIAKVYFVDYPNAKQSYILLGSKAMPIADASYYPTTVANYQLGHSAGSQLFDVLRLQKGYTYGAYSRLSCGLYENAFCAYSSVQAGYTVESMKIFKELVSQYSKSYNQELLNKTKATMTRGTLAQFEDPADRIEILSNITTYGLPIDYITRNEQVIKSMDVKSAKSYIDKWINYDNMVFVVVGDAKTQLPLLKEAGFGDIVVVDSDANPVL